MADNNGEPLLSVHLYAMRQSGGRGVRRGVLAGVELHGHVPGISPDDIRCALLAMADALVDDLARIWAADAAGRN